MMDVAMIGPFPDDVSLIKGGVQASVYGLAKALKHRGDVRSVRGISTPIKANAHLPVRNVALDGIEIICLNAPYKFLASGILHLPRVARELSGLPNPVAHVHGTGLFQLALLALLRAKRIPCVWTLHGIVEKETRQRYEEHRSAANLARYWFYRIIERTSLALAPQVIVDTPYVKEALAISKPVHVIPQGIFMEELAPLQALPRPEPLVISLGVLDPRKGHHLTLEAFARVKKKIPQARLIIAGSPTIPSYGDLLKRRIAELGLGACVELCINRPRPEIIALLGKARLFALHSREESQGIALCEALAAGVPVAATRVGGIPYVVENGKDGLLCDYGDVNAFAADMQRLLADDALHEAFAAQAKQAARRFSWDKIAEEIMGLYRSANGERTLNPGFDEEVKGTKTEAMIDIIREIFPRRIGSILVVGCGSGREAGMLARAFDANVTGIDVGDEFMFDHAGSAPAKLMIMDGRRLDFPDASFDMVFSFHALEHIPQPELALAEMTRVLKPGGAFLIGTPNKARLLGYIGSAHPLHKKVWWNCKDTFMRVTGRWSNEKGAHAGFTVGELRDLCGRAFGDASDISDRYYRRVYRRRAQLVERIIRSGVKGLLFPCVYVAGTKSA